MCSPIDASTRALDCAERLRATPSLGLGPNPWPSYVEATLGGERSPDGVSQRAGATAKRTPSTAISRRPRASRMSSVSRRPLAVLRRGLLAIPSQDATSLRIPRSSSVFRAAVAYPAPGARRRATGCAATAGRPVACATQGDRPGPAAAHHVSPPSVIRMDQGRTRGPGVPGPRDPCPVCDQAAGKPVVRQDCKTVGFRPPDSLDPPREGSPSAQAEASASQAASLSPPARAARPPPSSSGSASSSTSPAKWTKSIVAAPAGKPSLRLPALR